MQGFHCDSQTKWMQTRVSGLYKALDDMHAILCYAVHLLMYGEAYGSDMYTMLRDIHVISIMRVI